MKAVMRLLQDVDTLLTQALSELQIQATTDDGISLEHAIHYAAVGGACTSAQASVRMILRVLEKTP